MRKKTLTILATVTTILFALFFGCGERSGEKEYEKALSSLESGQLSRAQGQMEKAVRQLVSNEQKSVANNQLGLILWQLGKTDEATEKFKESCRLSENMTQANMNYAIALYKNNQLEAAQLEFVTLLGEQPNNPIAHLFSGLIHIKEKKWVDAQHNLSKGLQLKPKDPALQNAYALIELHKDGNNKALTRLKQIIAVHPNYTPALYNIAAIYDFKIHNYPVAIEWYRKYLQKAGTQAAQSSRTQEALSRLTRSRSGMGSSSSSSTITAFIKSGEKLHKQKRYSSAIKQYKKAIQLSPNNIKAHYDIGLAYFYSKKYSSAERSFIQTLRLNPRDPNARYMLVLTYTKQRKWNDAEREAKALKVVNPKQGKAMLKYISETRRR